MITLYAGDAREVLRALPRDFVHCVVTSPPYWGLRDYSVHPLTWGDGWRGSLGLEPTLKQYIDHLTEIFREVRRVLRPDGTFWLNLGDSYTDDARGRCRPGRTVRDMTGLRPKNACGVPWRVAFALQDDGWYLRSPIIWAKPNPIPESGRAPCVLTMRLCYRCVKAGASNPTCPRCRGAGKALMGAMLDRPTRSHETIFLFAKSERYFYDAVAVSEDSVHPESLLGLRRCNRSKGQKLGYATENIAAVPPGRTYPIRNRRDVWWEEWDAQGELPDLWPLSTQAFRGAHFATFPERMVKLCVLAGTSARGCCPSCGAPWQRVVGKVRTPTRPGEASKVRLSPPVRNWVRVAGDRRDVPAHRPEVEKLRVGFRDPYRHITAVKTLRWQPGCECGGAPEPCVVLDPFIGSGSTAVAADALGRHCVGIDLSSPYIKMAGDRVLRRTRRKLDEIIPRKV